MDNELQQRLARQKQSQAEDTAEALPAVFQVARHRSGGDTGRGVWFGHCGSQLRLSALAEYSSQVKARDRAPVCVSVVRPA